MKIAQKLYEGVDLGDGPTGLITYMRTDSTRVSSEALAEVRTHVAERYGTAYLPASPNFYRGKIIERTTRLNASDPSPAKMIGEYDTPYRVAINGSWAENYGSNFQQDGPNIGLSLGASDAPGTSATTEPAKSPRTSTIRPRMTSAPPVRAPKRTWPAMPPAPWHKGIPPMPALKRFMNP